MNVALFGIELLRELGFHAELMGVYKLKIMLPLRF